MSTILKRIPVELKDPDKGLVRAILATFDVVDKDGDITRKGFFGDQGDVPILWGHDWGMMPLGLADITETKDTAVLDGALNLDTQAGRDALAVLKFQGDAQEWSYGFSILAGGSTPLEPGENDGAWRELHATADGGPGAKVAEASPVVVGAGEGTMTVSVKMADTPGNTTGNVTNTITDNPPTQLAEHVGSVTDDLSHLAERVAKVRSIRKDGKLGAATKDALAKLGAAIVEMGEALAEPPSDDPPVNQDPPPADPPPTEPTAALDDDFALVLADARLRGIT